MLLAGIQVVGMSATIGNLRELAEFLSADIYHKDFRPVELREYIKCGADLLEVKKDAIDIESAFVHARTVNFSVSLESISLFELKHKFRFHLIVTVQRRSNQNGSRPHSRPCFRSNSRKELLDILSFEEKLRELSHSIVQNPINVLFDIHLR